MKEKPNELYHTGIEIKDWIESSDFSELKMIPKEIKERLKAAGIWRRYLEQSFKDFIRNNSTSTKEEDTSNLEEEAKVWETIKTQQLGLSKEEVRKKIKTNSALKKLSVAKWEVNIESAFLERKSEFDKASCKILRMVNKDLLNELYFRIKNNEITFEQASIEYGQLPEKKSGGKIGYKPLGEMEFGLGPLLEKMKVGQLSQPLRIGTGFCIVELEKFSGAELDEETREKILYEKLKSWMKEGVDQAVDLLE